MLIFAESISPGVLLESAALSKAALGNTHKMLVISPLPLGVEFKISRPIPSPLIRRRICLRTNRKNTYINIRAHHCGLAKSLLDSAESIFESTYVICKNRSWGGNDFLNPHLFM